MPYDKNAELPKSVQNNLSIHAQDIYREAFNSAWEQYKEPSKRKLGGSREETSHRVAWSAVEKVYTKSEEGKWIEKDKK